MSVKSIRSYVPDSERRYQISQTIAGIVRSKVFLGLLLGIAIVWYNFPIWYTFVSSLKSIEAIHNDPMTLLPTDPIDPIWANYAELWFERQFDAYVSNSLIVAITTTFIVMILGTLGGYGFSRFRFRYDSYVFVGILMARLLPPIGMLVPFYRLFLDLHLLDTELVLIIVHTYLNLPLVIWLMRNYFISIPADLDEAAYIDGATRFQTFKDIILPLAKPGIAAVAILTFLFSWRDFLMAFIMTTSDRAVTVPVAATLFQQDVVVLWNYLSAAGFIAMLPGILFVIVFQRYIVTGLTSGAVKG
jgi:multiple sugar transport system permease protein